MSSRDRSVFGESRGTRRGRGTIRGESFVVRLRCDEVAVAVFLYLQVMGKRAWGYSLTEYDNVQYSNAFRASVAARAGAGTARAQASASGRSTAHSRFWCENELKVVAGEFATIYSRNHYPLNVLRPPSDRVTTPFYTRSL